MQCSHLTCTKPATIRCSACKTSGYCSEEHQKDDWKVGRHALVCSQMQVNGPMDDATPMEVSNRSFFLGTSKVITPEMLTNYFALELTGRGQYGVVLHARVITSPLTEFALKITFGSPEAGHREAAVGHLMTTLYAACEDPVGALLPVIKVYDSGYSVWTAEEARRFLSPFVAHGPAVSDYPREVLTARIGGSVQTTMTLMEYSQGMPLVEYLYHVRRQPQKQAEKLVLDVLVQVLLVLSDLEAALEFVHYDLHTDNVMVETVPSGSMVWHFTASSDTSFNVHTNVRPRLLDFGFARLRRGSTFYASRNRSLSVEGGTLEEYRPWADLHKLASWIINGMGEAMYNGLEPSSNLLIVLSHMLGMEVAPTPGAAGYIGLRQGLQAKLHPYDGKHQAVSFEDMAQFARDANNFVVQASPDSPSSTAYSVLKDSQTALVDYISYKPVDTDTIVEMSLHVGRSSLATKSAWKAVEKAAARSWWSALGSP